jgi:hypothetical protein
LRIILLASGPWPIPLGRSGIGRQFARCIGAANSAEVDIVRGLEHERLPTLGTGRLLAERGGILDSQLRNAAWTLDDDAARHREAPDRNDSGEQPSLTYFRFGEL